MLLGAHLITGAVAGEYVDDPFLAFVTGIVLHFILDSIPHFDTTDDGKITVRQVLLIGIDGTAGIAILFYGYRDFSIHHWSYLAGALGGIFPDLIDNVPLWQKVVRSTKIGKKFNQFHTWIQWRSLSPIPGLAVQYIVITVMVLILIKLK